MRLQRLQPSSDISNIRYQDFTHAHPPLSAQDFGSGGRAGLAATLGVCSMSIKSNLKEQPPRNIIITHLCSLVFAMSFPASTSLCSKRRNLAFTAGQDLATRVHVLEGFFLGPTTQPAHGKGLREVWWGWLWPHRCRDLKGIQSRH